jgi:hypothetical protein
MRFIELLHKAADRVAAEVGTVYMDALADAISSSTYMFLNDSSFTGDDGIEVHLDSVSVCYGMMIGYLAGLGDQ